MPGVVEGTHDPSDGETDMSLRSPVIAKLMRDPVSKKPTAYLRMTAEVALWPLHMHTNMYAHTHVCFKFLRRLL